MTAGPELALYPRFNINCNDNKGILTQRDNTAVTECYSKDVGLNLSRDTGYTLIDVFCGIPQSLQASYATTVYHPIRLGAVAS
jgi:hypothetical protein